MEWEVLQSLKNDKRLATYLQKIQQKASNHTYLLIQQKAKCPSSNRKQREYMV